MLTAPQRVTEAPVPLPPPAPPPTQLEHPLPSPRLPPLPPGRSSTRGDPDAYLHHCEDSEPTPSPPDARPSPLPSLPETGGSGATPGSDRYIRGTAEPPAEPPGKRATSLVPQTAEGGAPRPHGGSAIHADPRSRDRRWGDQHPPVPVQRGAQPRAPPVGADRTDEWSRELLSVVAEQPAQEPVPVWAEDPSDSPGRHSPLSSQAPQPHASCRSYTSSTNLTCSATN